jgi:molybdenum cofactor cytidylyltransferase
MASQAVMLVLAAGRGERMGGPKALLLIDGQPLADLHAQHLPTLIVAAPSVAVGVSPRSTIIPPDRPHALGPAGSIGAAVRSGALAPYESVVITPVDVLPAPRPRIDALLAALQSHDAARSHRGHPVAVRRSILERHYRDGDPILRDLLDSLDCARLPPDEAGVLDDLDTPEDVVRITGSAPRFLVR